MTVSTQFTKRIYAGNGLTRVWEVDFPLLSENDLHIFVTSPDGIETEITNNFAFNDEKTAVIYPTEESEQSPLAEGWSITLVRHTPLTQEIDLLRQGELDAEVLEGGYDKLTLLLQELAEQTNRSVKYPVSTPSASLPGESFLNDLLAAKQTAITASNQAVSAAQTAQTNATAVVQSSQNALNAIELAAQNGQNILTEQAQTLLNQFAQALAEAQEGVWRKPAAWPDIRSGALDNSVYFLVAHSADYTDYPQFAVQATIAEGGTYDVYVDGVKQATTASGSNTVLDWQTLALPSGWEVAHPAALRAHIVRVTPSDNTKTITLIRQVHAGQENKGVLWVHFALDYALHVANVWATETSPYFYCPLCEAVTAKNDELKVTGDFSVGFWGCSLLKVLPKLDLSACTTGTNYWTFRGCENLKEIPVSAGQFIPDDACFSGAHSLKKLPPLKMPSGEVSLGNFLAEADNLEDTVLDFSQGEKIKRLHLGGSSTHSLRGVKAVTLSPSAPFDSAISPQVDVSYTGLGRVALINLFHSIPHNVGYTVTGTPTLANGVASGFSSSDYLQLQKNLPVLTTTNNWEMGSKIITPASGDGIILGITTWYLNGFRYANNGKKVVAQFFDYANGAYVEVSSGTLSPNTAYYIKTYCSGTNLVLAVSTDKQIWSEYTTALSSNFTTNPTDYHVHLIGGGGNYGTFGGSINLNETYIRIHGVPFFTGQAATTKTCSVVGCTGTADLTAADKAIATAKGWELTVA